MIITVMMIIIDGESVLMLDNCDCPPYTPFLIRLKVNDAELVLRIIYEWIIMWCVMYIWLGI